MIHYRMELAHETLLRVSSAVATLLVGLLRVMIVAIGNLDAALGPGKAGRVASPGAAGGDGSGTVRSDRGWAKSGRTRSGGGQGSGVGGRKGTAWVWQSHFVASLNNPTWPTWHYFAV